MLKQVVFAFMVLLAIIIVILVPSLLLGNPKFADLAILVGVSMTASFIFMFVILFEFLFIEEKEQKDNAKVIK